MRKILVTGSEGYIGSILMPLLITNGFTPVGLDVCYYSEANISKSFFPEYKLIIKDIRNFELSDLINENYEAIIHLAALSNDPLGMLDENLTFNINFQATVRMGEIAKKAGIKRFIYSSSCSLYGLGSKQLLNEESPPYPQTAYGKSKILAENGLSELADNNFSPVFMRNATAFGLSPRMRFDLVVNSLCGFAKIDNEIKILGDGKPWRPLVHIHDIASAMINSLNQPKDKIHNQAFNVGSNSENYQILTIAEKVKERYPGCNISVAMKDAGDSRDYNVSFDKINKVLSFSVSRTLSDGINELADCFRKINLDPEVFHNRLYNRLKQIQYLRDNNIINNFLIIT